MRYRIGEFARLGAVSVKTLRYYDAIGLLAPAQIDARSRYRWYAATQLADLAAIRALKDLGASLRDIRSVVTRAAPDRRRKLLERLRTRARHSLETTRRSLEWIDLELEDQVRELQQPSIILQERGEIRVASIRARLGSYADIVPVERDLTRALHADAGGDTRGILWHRCEASGAIEGEPFIELKCPAPRAAGIELKWLPRVRVATAWCECEDAAAVRTYDAIDRWIHRHALVLDGPKREIYVGNILEIQFPVRPA
jgi:DNA-binding transcriptional MerR regulator